MAITVYQYPKCSTCRKALKWLDAQGIAYRSIDLVKEPPSASVLKSALRTSGRPLRALFNTSGESYRAGNFKARLPELSEAQAIAELTADGKLIKRPLLVGDGVALLGFDESEWGSALREK